MNAENLGVLREKKQVLLQLYFFKKSSNAAQKYFEKSCVIHSMGHYIFKSNPI